MEYSIITVPEGTDLSEVSSTIAQPGVNQEVTAAPVVDTVMQDVHAGLPEQHKHPVYVDASTGLNIDPKDLKYYIINENQGSTWKCFTNY